MWTEFLRNGQTVHGAFGNEIPDLKGLTLEQIVLNHRSELALTLRCAALPPTIPVRWKERGCDRLQLRMSFGLVGNLIIKGNQASCVDTVAIELDKNKLRVAAENTDFELTADFHEGRLYLYPYRASEFEFPPTWFNPY